MPDPNNSAYIRAYLEQHRATQTRDGLRARLLAEGLAPEAVDAGLAQVYGDRPAPQQAPDDRPQGDPELAKRIREYVDHNRRTYTEDTLRAKLLADGYDPQVVDRAMADVLAERRERTPSILSRHATAVTVGVLVVTALLNFSLCVLGISGLAGAGGAIGPIPGAGGAVGPILIGAAVSIIASILLWRRQPAIARGIAIGFVLWPVVGVIMIIAYLLFVKELLAWLRLD